MGMEMKSARGTTRYGILNHELNKNILDELRILSSHLQKLTGSNNKEE
jgi:hypothetical protein